MTLSRHSSRRGGIRVAFLGSLVLASGTALAQRPEPAEQPELLLAGGILEAMLAAVMTLLIGGVLILVAPEFSERVADRSRSDPVISFLVGVGILIFSIVATILLFITIIGILLAIPLWFVLVGAATYGYLAAGRAATPNWGGALLVAVVVSAVTSGVPIVGTLIGFVLGSIGIGAFVMELLGDDDASPSTRVETSPSASASGSSGFDESSWGTDRDEQSSWGTDRDEQSSWGTDRDEQSSWGVDSDDEPRWRSDGDDDRRY